jgi:molybdate transport system substrate-binding protein
MFLATMFVSALAAGAAFAQGAKKEDVKVYAAAVAKTPLTAIAAEYEKATGNTVSLVFDTAGATEQKFRADPQAALLITTVPLIRNAETSGALREGTSTLLGSTVAGVIVTPGSKKPDVSTAESLKAALLAAKRIAVSDPARGATVGTHFMKVIETLGVKDDVLRKVTFSVDGIETTRRVIAARPISASHNRARFCRRALMPSRDRSPGNLRSPPTLRSGTATASRRPPPSWRRG